MGFWNFSNNMFVWQLKEVVYCSTLEGVSPSCLALFFVFMEIVIIGMSLLSREYLIPLVMKEIFGSSVWSVILFYSKNPRLSEVE